MKAKNLIVAALVVFSVSNSFAWYTRTTSNGGPNGYDKTSKDITDGNTTISCTNPGYSACPNRPANPAHDELVDAALAQIASGNLSGSITTADGTVNWTSDDSNMTNSSITIN